MKAYLYCGNDRRRDVHRLAVSMASLQQSTLLVTFGKNSSSQTLASCADVFPLDLLDVELPEAQKGHGPMIEVMVRTLLGVLRTIVSSDRYRLVILEGIRQATDQKWLDDQDLRAIVAGAGDDTEVALT